MAKTQHLSITGMHCASCVSKIERALKDVPNVTAANVNLITKSATVTGDANEKNLLAAVSQAGYEASVQNDAQQQTQESDSAEQRFLQRTMLKMIVAFVVGIPLVLAPFLPVFPDLSTTTGRWVWGVIGIITLAVM